MPYDFERGAKTTGSKWYFNSGSTALREWNLINFMMGYAMGNGYDLVFPPHLVRRQVGEWAGQLPRFENDYYLTTDDLMLIPTAETALVGMHANELFLEEQLPIKYVALSPCYRREAGAAGQRDKGLKRVHQFHKLELFVICTPDQSEALHLEMVKQVCDMLNTMGVNHRTVELSVDDRSPVSTRTIDVEIDAGAEGWLEVSSISNTGDNQARPAMIRYRRKSGGKPVKCHLLNGSAVALPRLMVYLMERDKTKPQPVSESNE